MYKKIDIFQNGKYLCSTNWSKTCKEAISKIKNTDAFIAGKGTRKIDGKITAHFAK
jgi:hypothetical protein